MHRISNITFVIDYNSFYHIFRGIKKGLCVRMVNFNKNPDVKLGFNENIVNIFFIF